MELLTNLIVIIGVILLFNVMIFVHELGHFLAARWRGLVVDKFYIWFGKPIWKKTIKGVEYGLGSIPAGGFVALPQMAPMEAIEGGDKERRRAMPEISPLDKIIVAFAGPLFSFLLAFAASVGVWILGKPNDTLPTTTIGYVEEQSPAAEAGLEVGDRILAVDGHEVTAFFGGMEGITERIMLSEEEQITFRVEREGEEMTIVSDYDIPETAWWQRRAMRKVGISFEMDLIVDSVMEGSPAEKAGLQSGDQLVSVNGVPLLNNMTLSDELKKNVGESVPVEIRRDGETFTVPVLSVVPRDKNTGQPVANGQPMIGIGFQSIQSEDRLIKPGPNPVVQIKESVRLMIVTVQKIAAKLSPVGIQHLSGPIGIGRAMFDFLKSDYALNYILWFMVILNINLGIMNLLPFPVLDGGHIVLATGEWIARRPVQFKVLESIQTVAVVLLLFLFVFIASKDIGDLIPSGEMTRTEDLYWEF
ncbi:MAG: RIP metalloprotease RseP [Verrucomicrobiota bacterium JB023]|nr:RIP metalloprotease RseP [Verrucomicrobiota bacterium JB023]